jgi:hypothetical protein
MQKKHTLYILILLFITNKNGFAQAVGYMGNKFSIGYSFGISPALINPNNSGNMILNPYKDNAFPSDQSQQSALGPKQKIISANITQAITVDYVAGRRLSIGFSYAHFNTKAFAKGTYANYNYIDSSSYPPQSGLQSEIPIGMINISTSSYTLGGKFFFKKYIAPFGRYWGVDLSYLTSKVQFDNTKFYVEELNNGNYSSPNTYVPLTGLFGATNTSFSKVDMLLSLGRQRIFFNRIMFNYGTKVSMAGMGAVLKDFFNSTQQQQDGGPDQSVYIKDISVRRIREFNLLTFYFNVSILIF